MMKMVMMIPVELLVILLKPPKSPNPKFPESQNPKPPSTDGPYVPDNYLGTCCSILHTTYYLLPLTYIFL